MAAQRDTRDTSDRYGPGTDTEVEPQPTREPDYYAVLSVAPGASEAEIRAAFRRLAKIWHPDRHGADSPEMRARAERRMRAVLRAYAVLGRPAARAAYDLRRARRGRLTIGGYSDAAPFGATDHPFEDDGWRRPLQGVADKRASDSFAGTLGGVLALLLALGIAGHLIRSGGASGLGGLAELGTLFALLALAVALLASGSPLSRAGDAYFERNPKVEDDGMAGPATAFRGAEEFEPPTDFELLVEEALASVPGEFDDYLRNVVVQVQDEPTEEQLRRMRMEPCSMLLGLYEGVPLTAQGAREHPPEIVTIFQRPIEEYCGHDPARMRRQVQATVLHELAHHFGMDHDAMPEWIR